MSGRVDTFILRGSARVSATHPPHPPSFIGWVSDLARVHTRALSAVATAEGLSADDALDAVQEAFHTFLNLPEATTLVGDELDARRLLSTIVRNVARNM